MCTDKIDTTAKHTKKKCSISILSATDLIFKEDTNDWIAIDLFVHHQAKDTHHGSSAVVQLDGALSQFLKPMKMTCIKQQYVRIGIAMVCGNR
jgi:hypothetical protein